VLVIERSIKPGPDQRYQHSQSSLQILKLRCVSGLMEHPISFIEASICLDQGLKSSLSNVSVDGQLLIMRGLSSHKGTVPIGWLGNPVSRPN
jgi:hypothetical protein